MIEQGTTVFFEDKNHSWIVGEVENWDGTYASCRPRNPKDGRDLVHKVKEEQMLVARAEMIAEEVDDLLNLTFLHDATLLNCLKMRYMRDVIYTNIGAIVVALNPFNFKIPWYMDNKMDAYLEEGYTIEKNLPHSWAVAHNTYWEMRNDHANQSVLVSGESGAGKTEASKIVMKYLAQISCKDGSDAQRTKGAEVGARINLTSPPLECFGNAKTVRNDNSSRFGKFMKVKFDSEGFLIGAHITKYLLEKSRIVTAAEGERCYHSLYLVCRGSDAPIFGVQKDTDFSILTSGKTLKNVEFDTAEEYKEVNTAMSRVGISEQDIRSMWTVVSAVLFLGNVSFAAEGEGSVVDAASGSVATLKKAAGLLCVPVDGGLQKELLTTTLTVAGQLITKYLNPTAAQDAKEALMKSLYDASFQWLVDKCNAVLDCPDEQSGNSNWIGLLDIFGFEDFTVNSFEQLCINLANESLQNHYNTYIFQKDLDECRAEGVDMSAVEFPDNGPCIQMITGKGGVMALLDEECMLGKGSDMGFLEKIATAFNTPNHAKFFLRKMLQKSSFTIHHYAGSVTYEVEGFLDKNRDTLKDALKLLMRSSTNTFVAALLPEPVEAGGRRTTVGGFFKNQLKELMDLLNSTNPHWIRCIKPHPAKKPLHWMGPSVMAQLASSGVLGTVKIRKAGYPVRMKVADFLARYKILGRNVEAIFKQGKVAIGTEAQKGTVRVFLKTEAYQRLEQRKSVALLDFARTSQAFARALIQFKGIAVRQREANKTLYEILRARAVRALEMQTEEESERQRLQDKLQRNLADMKKAFKDRLEGLREEHRRAQIQRMREQYEKQERERREQMERDRIEEQRREARKKRDEEHRRRANELRALEEQAVTARRRRDEAELEYALAAQTALEHQLTQQARSIFEARDRKQMEDAEKRRMAAIRRTEMEQEQLDKLKLIVQATTLQQKRGELIKERLAFEEKQQREARKVKMEGRRREVAAQLKEEGEAKQRVLEMQLAIANAKHSFQDAQKKQIRKDNCARQHLQFIERHEMEKERTIRQGILTQKERAIQRVDHGEREQQRFEDARSRLEHNNQMELARGDALMSPIYEYKKSASVHQTIAKITSQVAVTGEKLFFDPVHDLGGGGGTTSASPLRDASGGGGGGGSPRLDRRRSTVYGAGMFSAAAEDDNEDGSGGLVQSPRGGVGNNNSKGTPRRGSQQPFRSTATAGGDSPFSPAAKNASPVSFDTSGIARLDRAYKCKLKPKKVSEIDPRLYDRIAGAEARMTQQYGTAAMSTKSLYSLPWKI